MPTVLSPSTPAYPPLLAATARPPALWVRGQVTPEDALAIAIVGSRRATPYGLATAEELAGDLASRGVTIVSGLARGIDAAAHRGALAAGGRTIAVLGSGIDTVYPPEHGELAESIERQGAVVSQFPPGTPPLRQHFPMRNAVIAGLALGVVVVEAAEQSGALITARLAADLGREVYAVPGRVSSAQSRGAHGLLRDGARLVGEWGDVVQELPEAWRRLVRDTALETGDANRPASPHTPKGDPGRLMDLLRPDEPQHIDVLIEQSGLAPTRVAAELVRLELDGRARQMAGQRWLAVAAARSSARRT
jgi:DNA processing protein